MERITSTHHIHWYEYEVAIENKDIDKLFQLEQVLIEKFKNLHSQPFISEDLKKIQLLQNRFSTFETLENKELKNLAKRIINLCIEILKRSESIAPARPLKSNQLNKEKIKLWIEAHKDPLVRNAAIVLLETVQHVSQEEFESNFLDTIQDFNRLVQSEKNFEYVAAVEIHKSNMWMAQLAQPHLLLQPRALVSLVYVTELKEFISPGPATVQFHKNIVFFEDAIFSGEQMSRIITNMIQGINRANKEIEQNNKSSVEKIPFIPIPRFIIACAYLTEYGKNNILPIPKKYLTQKIKIIILKHQVIPTVEEAIKKKLENSKDIDPSRILSTLAQAYWPAEETKKMPMAKGRLAQLRRENQSLQKIEKEKIISFTRGAKSRGVVYFDHKVPDEYSFPDALAKGNIIDKFGNIIDNIELITYTRPPYK